MELQENMVKTLEIEGRRRGILALTAAVFGSENRFSIIEEAINSDTAAASIYLEVATFRVVGGLVFSKL